MWWRGFSDLFVLAWISWEVAVAVLVAAADAKVARVQMVAAAAMDWALPSICNAWQKNGYNEIITIITLAQWFSNPQRYF